MEKQNARNNVPYKRWTRVKKKGRRNIGKMWVFKKQEEDMKQKNKRKVNWRRIWLSLMMMALGITMFAFPAFADTVSANNVMSNLISLMCSMFKYVGAAIFVWAIIQFILATKRSDADSKADAIQTAMCGVALMGISGIVSVLGIGKALDAGGDDITITDDKLKG